MKLFKPTALYGKDFIETGVAHQYALRVYTGGLAGRKAASTRALKEADRFIRDSDYVTYHFLAEKRVWFPFSCYEYLFEFSKPHVTTSQA
jgi:hypothetical protein